MIEPRLLARLERKKAQLDGLRSLPVAAVRRLEEQLTIEWIYNSNAIEGSTLTLKETRLILETGLTIGGRSLREHFEVIDHKDAIVYVETDEWIPLREAAQGTPYSQEYLSLLARKGRLEAIKRGRVWMTTRRAVAAYRQSVSGGEEE
jgi:Fic family protein